MSARKRGDYVALFSAGLVNCAPHVTAYGSCVGALIDTNVSKGACSKEWAALSMCFNQTLRTRLRGK